MGEPFRRRVALGVLFVTGATLGLLAWEVIWLPLDNPWEVAGLFSKLGSSPHSNLLRFACLLLLSVSGVGFLLLPQAEKLRRLCLARELRSPGRCDPSRCDLPPRSKALLAIVFALLAGTAALPLRNDVGQGALDTFHEGESLGPAALMEGGAVLYADFIPAHGAFQDPLRSVLAFALMDRSIAATRTLQSVLKIIALALLGVFVVQAFAWKSPPALALLATFLFLNVAPMLPESGPRGLTWLIQRQRDLLAFAFLIALVGLHRRLATGRTSGPAVAAMSFVVAFIPLVAFGYATDSGVYISAAWVVLMAVLLIGHSPTGPALVPILLGSAAGISVGFAVLFAVLGEGFEAWLEFTFLIQPRYWGLLAGRIYTVRCVFCLVPLLLVAANSFWLALHLAREWHARGNARWLQLFLARYFVEIALYVVSIFFFHAALGRADAHHIAIGSAFTYVLSLFIVLRHVLPARLGTERAQRFASVLIAAVFIVLALVNTPDASLRAMFERNFPWGMPDTDLVPGEYGAVADFLDANLNEDEYFYVLTSEAIWYYLTDRPCPTRFPVVYYAAPTFYQAEVVRDLEGKNVKYVIVRNASWWMAIDGIGVAERTPAIAAFVRDHYRPLTKIGSTRIWERKSAASRRSAGEVE